MVEILLGEMCKLRGAILINAPSVAVILSQRPVGAAVRPASGEPPPAGRSG
jgi:hypothetical protein